MRDTARPYTGSAREFARRLRPPDWLALGAALLIWRLFFPGLMSIDSVAQYTQARSGVFNDWHPPLLAAVLRLVLGLGGGLGLLMLAQCVAGVLGVRALASAVLVQLWGDRLAPRARAWLSLLVLVLLLVPLSPLAFYLMTFWKDAWAMVLLLWIAAQSLALLRDRSATAASLPGEQRDQLRRAAAIAALAAALGLTRHNAVVLLPVVGLVLWRALAPAHRRAALVFAVAPLVGWAVADAVIVRAFQVRPMHPDSQVMALDLVGICAHSAAACAELPWTQSHVLDPAALAAYRPGDIGFIFWDQPRHVDPSIRGDYPRLRDEYLAAWRRFPGLLVRIKLAAFATQLGVDRTYYFFHDSIAANPFDLQLGARFEPARRRLGAVARTVAASPWRWVSGVHLVWLLANLAAIVALCGAWLRDRRSRHLDFALVLSLPLAYYLSYLAATPVPDFRFMYPATLTVQCVALATALGALVQMPAGWRPSRSRFSSSIGRGA